jgi:hypothetical protein
LWILFSVNRKNAAQLKKLINLNNVWIQDQKNKLQTVFASAHAGKCTCKHHIHGIYLLWWFVETAGWKFWFLRVFSGKIPFSYGPTRVFIPGRLNFRDTIPALNKNNCVIKINGPRVNLFS